MSSLVAQMAKNLPAVQETQVWSLGQGEPLEKEMATHSSILAWRIPWIEEPGGLQSMGSQRVRHDWVTKHTPHICCIYNEDFAIVWLNHSEIPKERKKITSVQELKIKWKKFLRKEREDFCAANSLCIDTCENCVAWITNCFGLNLKYFEVVFCKYWSYSNGNRKGTDTELYT